MSDVVVRVEAVSKKFCRTLRRSMIYGAADALRSMCGIAYDTSRLREAEFWALDEVSFEVRTGEKLGFLGVNGSGKSTLLRLISGIYPPDKGAISVRGTVGALIAVGVGFHPHLTGRENVYLNGAILGMSRKELTAKLDDIVDFAELGSFIDAPVSTYSSGMTVRLGFSIAIHRVPEIMLVDEVLAVGDLAFQLKCQKRLAEYRQGGGTFIIVSHNMQMIRNTCDRVLWLDKGRIVEEGDVYTVCDHYENELLKRAKENHERRDVKNVMNYDSTVRLESVEFLDGSGNVVSALPCGEPLSVRVRYRTTRPVKRPMFTLALSNSSGVVVFELYSHRGALDTPTLDGEGSLTVLMNELSLKPDVYFLSVTLSEDDILNKLEWHEKSYLLQIEGSGKAVNQGIIVPNTEWRLE